MIAGFKSSGGSGGGHRGGNGGGFKGGSGQSTAVDMSVEDRYYSMKEYNSLSQAKKAGLRAIREKRGHKSGNNNNNNNNKAAK